MVKLSVYLNRRVFVIIAFFLEKKKKKKKKKKETLPSIELVQKVIKVKTLGQVWIAPSEDSDQPAYPHSLIRALRVHSVC